MISIVIDPSLKYPCSHDLFSPDRRFPEYGFDHISGSENLIYRAVRECFAQAGLDKAHYDTPAWNPLGPFVKPGDRVFVLCNFVFHRHPKESAEDFKAKCIHGSVLRALVDYLLLAAGRAGRVHFGNAPMQFCHWDSVLRETGAETVRDFYQKREARVGAQDLRLFAARSTGLGRVNEVDRRPESGGIEVDLGADSLLTDLDRAPGTRYRVMNYSGRWTSALHSQGSHRYAISRQVLESDVVVNLSKLKTHEKVGITCALKGCVGAVAQKATLPHHRFGPPEVGGDEYPSDRTGLMRWISAFHGRVWDVPPDRPGGNFLRVVDRWVRSFEALWAPVTEGGWWGNDTAWRMVLDLARILRHAAPSGKMNRFPPRRHLSFIDGVTGGEGDGPLYPKAVQSGVLIFGDNSVSSDYAAARLMGFDPDRIPMIREAQTLKTFPLTDESLAGEQFICNREIYSAPDLKNLSPRRYEAPPGWKDRL